MSHVDLLEPETIEESIRDLPALSAAAQRCGLEFHENQTHFNSWATDNGRLVGDYPLPAGYTEEELVAGKCLHAISIPKVQNKGSYDHYEIGIVPSKKFDGAYAMLHDFFGGALSIKAGKNLSKLRMFYKIEETKNEAAKRRMRCVEHLETDGTVTLTLTKSATF